MRALMRLADLTRPLAEFGILPEPLRSKAPKVEPRERAIGGAAGSDG